MGKNIYTQEYTVKYLDLDRTGKMTTVALAEYMQEASRCHSNSLGCTPEYQAEHKFGWIVLDFKTDIIRMPEYNEKIIVRTWPHSIESLCTYRQFEVLDEKGNQIAKATSRWIIYSFEKMRPIRLSDELKEMYALVDDVVLPNEFEKMDNVSLNADFTYDGIIEFRDVDVNWHMNNVRYIRKFMEAMSPEFLDKYEVDFYDIQYIHQMKADDNYTIYVKKVNEDEYIYNMIKQGNEEGKVNSSAHIKWRRIDESNN